ncbi:HNH endonuclease signature motif containing protein [Heyndrickxia oleronia]|uniref:HNH endonuclease n=1 Tax=Heyndrickxia oleronia TaxID=38875 RepID=UPI003F1FF3F4
MELLRIYNTTKEWKIRQNRESGKKIRESGYQTEWQRKNKDKIKAYNQKRQHKIHKINKDEWISCKRYFNNSCAYCGMSEEEHRELYKQDLHKDHVEHSGKNDLSNCVPACKSCNTSKHQKKLDEWYIPNNELWCSVFSQERLQKIQNWLESDYLKYIKMN